MSTCWFGLAVLALASQPSELATRIEHVTVFPAHALVRRVAQAPAGGGKFVVANLPAQLDPDTLRVRCVGADVVGIDSRERNVPALADARIEELRGRVRELEREARAVDDDIAVRAGLEAHLVGLLTLEQRSNAEALARGKVRPESWKQNLEFITGELLATRTQRRELGWKRADIEQRLQDARLELGHADAGAGVSVREVEFELAPGSAAAAVELEYVVGSAGWRPLYDLRASRDAKSVELAYRAAVWQQTGEDWNTVELALSTARPQLGAQGPEPRSPWLYLQEPHAGRMPALTADRAAAPSESAKDEDDGEKADKSWHAAVESQGLSMRFVLPKRETVSSRPEPINVLVGEAPLACTPEYFTTPSLDTNVWLRGKTVNTSEWALLPGVAAVFFGADFIGHATIEQVLPGEDFTLHLGPDPALVLERTLLKDLTSRGGMFSSKSSRKEGFRIRIDNTGAAAARKDGSALVYVREALPRSADERIVVELDDPKPKPSEDERWKKEREEQGFLTWALVVPKGGESVLTYATTIRFPEGAEVVR